MSRTGLTADTPPKVPQPHQVVLAPGLFFPTGTAASRAGGVISIFTRDGIELVVEPLDLLLQFLDPMRILYRHAPLDNPWNDDKEQN